MCLCDVFLFIVFVDVFENVCVIVFDVDEDVVDGDFESVFLMFDSVFKVFVLSDVFDLYFDVYV